MELTYGQTNDHPDYCRSLTDFGVDDDGDGPDIGGTVALFRGGSLRHKPPYLTTEAELLQWYKKIAEIFLISLEKV